MDKFGAIQEAIDRKKRMEEDCFKERVIRIVYEIEVISDTLRKLKKELTKMEYKEPELIESMKVLDDYTKGT